MFDRLFLELNAIEVNSERQACDGGGGQTEKRVCGDSNSYTRLQTLVALMQSWPRTAILKISPIVASNARSIQRAWTPVKEF